MAAVVVTVTQTLIGNTKNGLKVYDVTATLDGGDITSGTFTFNISKIKKIFGAALNRTKQLTVADKILTDQITFSGNTVTIVLNQQTSTTGAWDNPSTANTAAWRGIVIGY